MVRGSKGVERVVRESLREYVSEMRCGAVRGCGVVWWCGGVVV